MPMQGRAQSHTAQGAAGTNASILKKKIAPMPIATIGSRTDSKSRSWRETANSSRSSPSGSALSGGPDNAAEYVPDVAMFMKAACVDVSHIPSDRHAQVW